MPIWLLFSFLGRQFRLASIFIKHDPVWKSPLHSTRNSTLYPQPPPPGSGRRPRTSPGLVIKHDPVWKSPLHSTRLICLFIVYLKLLGNASNSSIKMQEIVRFTFQNELDYRANGQITSFLRTQYYVILLMTYF